MTWDVPVMPGKVDVNAMSGGTLLDNAPLYEDTPWTASGEYVGAGATPPDTGTPGLSNDLKNIGPESSWWDKLTSTSGSTDVLKAAVGVGGLAQLMAGRNAAASQRKVGALNTAVLENEAQFQLQKGKLEEQNLRKKYMVLAGKQKAAYGASGVKVNEGSPLMVLEDTYQAMHDDAALIRWNADIAATKLRNQIPGVQMEANLAANKSLSAGMDSLLTAGGRYWQLNA